MTNQMQYGRFDVMALLANESTAK